MQDDAFGVMHVPAVLVDAEGTPHFAPVRHGGPIVGSLLHVAPSAAGAMHVPVAPADGFTHSPPAAQVAKPVIGIAPTSPHEPPLAASVIAWHVPTALPFAAGMHASPRSAAQLAIVLREPSHAAPTLVPDGWHVPIVEFATSSPTHDKPASHGCALVRHGAFAAAYATHVPVAAPAALAHAMLRPQSAATSHVAPAVGNG